MRAVIDTNVLLSGLIWQGTPHALIEQVRDGTLTLITSPALLAELSRQTPVRININDFQHEPISPLFFLNNPQSVLA